MLPKKNRLSREKEIRIVLKAGRLMKGNLADIKYLKSGLEQARFLFLVSAKTAKKAHDRNRARRHLSEIFSRRLADIKQYDYAVIAKKNLIGKKQDEIENELIALLAKGGLLGG
jgi:ribonuclease P protein component